MSYKHNCHENENNMIIAFNFYNMKQIIYPVISSTYRSNYHSSNYIESALFCGAEFDLCLLSLVINCVSLIMLWENGFGFSPVYLCGSILKHSLATETCVCLVNCRLINYYDERWL